VDETNELAKKLGAPVHMLPEADHFFIRHRREVAGVVLRFFAPELVP
jgi:alpha/beta superfamily hydrolase